MFVFDWHFLIAFCWFFEGFREVWRGVRWIWVGSGGFSFLDLWGKLTMETPKQMLEMIRDATFCCFIEEECRGMLQFSEVGEL